MKRRILALGLAACCLLSGCSLLERSYSTVEPHSNRFWEGDTEDTLRAETYQDVVNDLLILVGRHAQSGILRLYNFGDDLTVTETMEAAASEVQQETPLGSYAVEYITSTSQALRGYHEVSVTLGYRRTEEQLQSIVNATSIAALRELLTAAMSGGKGELAVRVSYFSDQRLEVEQIVSTLRETQGLADTPPWGVSYYPQTGRVGLIEVVWVGQELPGDAAGGDTDNEAATQATLSQGEGGALAQPTPSAPPDSAHLETTT